jgi:hypothetical protein
MFLVLSSKPSCNAFTVNTFGSDLGGATHGPAPITVQGIFFPFSSKILVMPIYLPINRHNYYCVNINIEPQTLSGSYFLKSCKNYNGTDIQKKILAT